VSVIRGSTVVTFITHSFISRLLGNSESKALNEWIFNHELARMWKGTVMAEIEVPSLHSLGVTEKTAKPLIKYSVTELRFEAEPHK
jgi:hypothetical protein